MTNKEVIEILKPLTGYSVDKNGIGTFPMVSTPLQAEALTLAIEALENQVLTKNNQDSNQDDLIDNAPTVSLQDIYQEGHYDGHLDGYTKAINMETYRRCGMSDLISRAALKKAICEKGIKGYDEYNQGLAAALDLIDLAPPVDIQTAVMELYKRYQPRLATNVYEFGVELQELLGRYERIEKGGAE